MKKSNIILTIVIVAILVAAVVLFIVFKPAASNFTNIDSADKLVEIVNNIYEEQTMEMPMLQTMPIEVTDKDMVKMFTGVDDNTKFEYVVASEPMMSSQAYSLVIAKVKDGIDANAVAKEMNENVDARKWICVTAEKVYTTSSGNVVFLIMTSENTAKPIYNTFKELAGSVGHEYERVGETIELPAEG